MASTRGLTDVGRRGAPAGSQLTSGADGGPASEAEHLRGLSQHLPPLTSLSRLYCPVPARCCCFLQSLVRPCRNKSTMSNYKIIM